MEIRKAEAEDSSDVLKWRNDATTRAMSFEGGEITPEAHQSWFAQSLDSDKRLLYIGLINNDKIGVVRFDLQQEDECEVSINLNPDFRGKQLSGKLLRGAIRAFRHDHNDGIVARIRPENTASIQLFESCGFQRNASVEKVLVYRMK